jgi:hypothetical protein
MAGAPEPPWQRSATPLPASEIPQTNSPVMNGVIEHYSWNFVWFGIYAIVLAIFMNWRNSRVGYWFNLVVVSLTDFGFIFSFPATSRSRRMRPALFCGSLRPCSRPSEFYSRPLLLSVRSRRLVEKTEMARTDWCAPSA